jgi:hypothetical protein
MYGDNEENRECFPNEFNLNADGYNEVLRNFFMM